VARAACFGVCSIYYVGCLAVKTADAAGCLAYTAACNGVYLTVRLALLGPPGRLEYDLKADVTANVKLKGVELKYDDPSGKFNFSILSSVGVEIEELYCKYKIEPPQVFGRVLCPLGNPEGDFTLQGKLRYNPNLNDRLTGSVKISDKKNIYDTTKYAIKVDQFRISGEFNKAGISSIMGAMVDFKLKCPVAAGIVKTVLIPAGFVAGIVMIKISKEPIANAVFDYLSSGTFTNYPVNIKEKEKPIKVPPMDKLLEDWKIKSGFKGYSNVGKKSISIIYE